MKYQPIKKKFLCSTYYWPNGAKFSGKFINDSINGKGILHWPEPGKIFI